MKKWIIGVAAFAAAISSAPTMAQDSSYKLGPMWTASRIVVEDGQFENYMDFLTKTWADNQAFAKSQGWILDYYILNSVNPRDGEPDIILLSRFNDFPSAKEVDRRSAILNKRMSQDDHSAETASGERTKMRRLAGSVLYRELQKR